MELSNHSGGIIFHKKFEKKFRLSMYFLEFDQSKHCTR